MKRSFSLCLVFLLVVAFFAFGSISQEAKAFTMITLKAPADSIKMTNSTPTFEWTATPPNKEILKKFQIQLATDPNFNTIIWDDTTIAGTLRSKVYDGATPLVNWTAYYWRMRVQVDSIRTAQGDTINYWQEDFSLVFMFFYGTQTCIDIPTDLPTIQMGIHWAAQGDTILVDRGTYYENLRFYKKKLLLTSKYLLDQDTTTIYRTIIDGSKLARGEDKGSVVYFSSAVDSNSTIMGFTIRGGVGTKIETGTDNKVSGGGIFCDENSTPTIKYNLITGNRVKDDGGGILIYGGAPNIIYNLITDNTAENGSGGGIECRFSIEVKNLIGQKQGDGGTDDDFSAPTTQQTQVNEDQIENSLNPKDATEVFPVNSTKSLAKTMANTPPVAVIQWYARKDTLIQREKYLPGDTLFFDGTGSYDPDGGNDTLKWEWLQNAYYTCERSPSPSFSSFSTSSTAFIPITATSRLGLLKITLAVQDTLRTRVTCVDTITISVQYRPYPNAGSAFTTSPGDTAWLKGTASCDINPSDVLEYTWTQRTGTSVTIENANSSTAYFVPLTEAYLGTYSFQLKVSDGMEADSANVNGVVSTPPVPVCQRDPVWGDTLVGFTPLITGSTPEASDTFNLDACSSFDPDSRYGIKKYIWRPAGRWTYGPTGWTQQSILFTTTDKLCTQKKTHGFGGLLKFYLLVEDSLGVLSKDSCAVLFSIQLKPTAYAGLDTVVRTGEPAYLNGKAYETNPDQRSSIKYNWRMVSSPTPVSFIPSDTVKSVTINAGQSGAYKIQLTADDRMALSDPDEIIVIANKQPIVQLLNVDHAMDGREVTLDASSAYDPDSDVFGDSLKFKWTFLGKPANAETPVITDADKSIAKFIPYGTGIYSFQIIVHDTLSERQPYYSNIDTVLVTVDSTYAYPFIKGNLFSKNYAGAKGGGIDCGESSPDIFGNVFYKNESVLSGGAVCARGFSTPQIKSNIFFGNVSGNSTGSAIADLKGEMAPSATRGYRRNVTVWNNDFWSNQGENMYGVSGTVYENIYVFPRLVDPEFGDFTMECSSPCIERNIGILPFFTPCDSLNPLGMVSLSMFQNPAATAVAHFVVNSDAPLKAEPVAYVTVGNNAPSPVYFTAVSPNCFRGSFVFTSGGDAEISVLTSSVLEIDTTISENFSIQFIPADQNGTLSSSDQMVKLTFPQGSVKQDIYATCISVSGNSQYDFTGDASLEAIGESYQLGPSISFEKNLTVRFPLNSLILEEKNKTLFSVYRYDEGEWERLDSYLEGNSVCTEVGNLGIYRLVYDPAGKYITGRPTSFELYQNHPNPFNPETQIKYDLPVSGFVNLTIYNVLGQKVKTLVDEFQEVGRKSVIWDGRDDGGHQVASGIYFYKIKAENFDKTRKMILIK